jgi:hypothetical protein
MGIVLFDREIERKLAAEAKCTARSNCALPDGTLQKSISRACLAMIDSKSRE